MQAALLFRNKDVGDFEKQMKLGFSNLAATFPLNRQLLNI